ncbi:MAG: CADD family putative folate metabolism protein [Alphaproteobacteria bacterium]|nr:CADD family putative folate metabolism protein [Alphaproteobacteria bacterium]
MTFSEQLKATIADLHLLSHPFYQAWTRGELSQQELQHYAAQYQPFVEAFPRYVSGLHSRCDNAEARTMILENLMDEEGTTGRSAPHPQLWQDFMDGLGSHKAQQFGQAALAARDTYLDVCRSSYEGGLCALYAYEYQTPEISKTKIEGLKSFYGIETPEALAFFKVHETADVYHSATCEKLIDAIPADRQVEALMAARKAAQTLWDFLSEVHGDKGCAMAESTAA